MQQPNAAETIDNWKIVKKLGEGGFGAVYQVSDSKNPSSKQFALKTEKSDSAVRVLKMEVVVLRALKKSGATHSCDIFDTGKAAGFNFIVMTLVGNSLQDLRKDQADSRFTLGCALSVGQQCLESLQELHNVGYLHRDIKPANFAISLEDPRKILILDFGMCRRYVDKDSAVRNPRWATGFRGTLRYASISCHISREMCRKDDLETWLYQQIEITSGQLPWRHLDDVVQVCHAKEKGRTSGVKQLFGGCPKEYVHMLMYIDSLRYYDNPNYAILRGLLREAMDSNGVTEFPYDWEKKSTKM